MTKLFKYLFLTILVLFSLGQIQRVQLNEAIVFYAHDTFIATWLILIVLKRGRGLLTLIKKYFFNYLTYATISWVIIGLVINFIGHGFSFIPLLYLARATTYLLFALSLQLAMPKSYKSRSLWVLAGLSIAIIGLFQYRFFPDTRSLKYLGWDDHYFRLISTQLDPNFTGILLTITFFLAHSLKYKQKWIKVSLLSLLAGTILLTYSRASFLSFIIGSLLLIFIGFIKSQKKSTSLVVITALFIVLIPFLPRPDGEGVKLERTASISARIESNQFSLKSLSGSQWLYGKGLFTYRDQDRETSLWPNTAHFPSNLVVFLFTSTGIIGLGLALLILYRTGKYLYQKDIYIFTAFIAILIHSQFNHTLFQPFVWLWIITQVLTLEKTRT